MRDLPSLRYSIPSTTSVRDVADLNRVVAYARSAFRGRRFEVVLRNFLDETGARRELAEGRHRSPTAELVAYIKSLESPGTDEQTSKLADRFEVWSNKTEKQFRLLALDFLHNNQIPTIALFNVTTATLQEVAVSMLASVAFFAKGSVCRCFVARKAAKAWSHLVGSEVVVVRRRLFVLIRETNGRGRAGGDRANR